MTTANDELPKAESGTWLQEQIAPRGTDRLPRGESVSSGANRALACA